jgi:hypothetical protein
LCVGEISRRHQGHSSNCVRLRVHLDLPNETFVFIASRVILTAYHVPNAYFSNGRKRWSFRVVKPRQYSIGSREALEDTSDLLGLVAGRRPRAVPVFLNRSFFHNRNHDLSAMRKS